MIGQLLDHRYQITEVLAKGGFGQTYLARDTRRPGHPVCVVKQLIATVANSKPEALSIIHRLFNSEAEVLERLGRHDQIPQLLAHFDENQEFYLVQEYIPGHPLTDELVLGHSWTEAKAIEFLAGILDVLAFVHHQGVIHRDIKPANIIRREPDNKLVLIDFGAVKELKSSIALNKATIEIGTPGYIPIEQFRGYPQFNSDIYSVGVITIQAVTGLGVDDLVSLLDPNNPYRGNREWKSYAQISPALVNVLEKMTRPNYQERYQSVSEVLADLKPIVEGRANAIPDTVIGKVGQANSLYSATSQPVSFSTAPSDRAIEYATPNPFVSDQSASNPSASGQAIASPSSGSQSVGGQSVPNTVIGAGSTGSGAVQAFQPAFQPTPPPPSQPPRKPWPIWVKVLLWLGGGTIGLITLVFGLLVAYYIGKPRSNYTPATTNQSSSSAYFVNLKACEANSQRLCTSDETVFEDATVSKIQVTANIKNLDKGDKVKVVVKFRGVDGSTEKPFPQPYEVQGLEEERVFAVINRNDKGWDLGTYSFEFTAQGKSGPPARKTFAILKDGKVRR